MILLTAESTFKHKVSSVLNRSAEFASKVCVLVSIEDDYEICYITYTVEIIYE